MENTGNTGFVSIPLMLSNLYAGTNENLKKVIVCGFGAGLAIASTAVDLSGTNILPTGILKEDLK
jgi:3-oxoacyl-[acyl-carrier-protein] synthase III